MYRTAIASLAAAVVFPVMAAATPLPFYKEFKDWQVACDNGGQCEAKGFPPQESDQDAIIRITREAGPNGTLTVRLEAGSDISADALSIDGKRIPASVGLWTKLPADQGNGLVSRDGTKVAAFVQALRNAENLTLGAAGTVSLSGMDAALLAMDDAQGRVGTRTALIRPGDQPAGTVPAAPALPVAPSAPAGVARLTADKAKVIALAVRKSQAASLASADCDADAGADNAFALSADEALIILSCRTGAYQGSALLFSASIPNPTTSHPLMLRLPAGIIHDNPNPTNALVDPSYDPQKAVLSSGARGAGTGDCGVSQSWGFDGHVFHLISYSFQESCRGGFPGDWPALWRTSSSD